jgi:hypothetical protein
MTWRSQGLGRRAWTRFMMIGLVFPLNLCAQIYPQRTPPLYVAADSFSYTFEGALRISTLVVSKEVPIIVQTRCVPLLP